MKSYMDSNCRQYFHRFACNPLSIWNLNPHIAINLELYHLKSNSLFYYMSIYFVGDKTGKHFHWRCVWMVRDLSNSDRMSLLEYENQIFLDAFHEDGLLITARYIYSPTFITVCCALGVLLKNKSFTRVMGQFMCIQGSQWKSGKPGDLNIICPGLEIAWNLSPKVRKPWQNKKFNRKPA